MVENTVSQDVPARIPTKGLVGAQSFEDIIADPSLPYIDKTPFIDQEIPFKEIYY